MTKGFICLYAQQTLEPIRCHPLICSELYKQMFLILQYYFQLLLLTQTMVVLFSICTTLGMST